MPLDFPSSPTLNQTYTFGGKTWVWNGTGWRLQYTTSSTDTITAAAFVPAGSTVPTNGVYLPSANTVGVATNGTGRLYIDSAGNVGVGAASAGVAVDITRSGANCLIRVNRTDAAVAGVLSFAAGNGINYIDSTGAKDFAVNTNSTERLRITSDGKLGLGTSAPANLLEAYGDGQRIAARANSTGGEVQIEAQTTDYWSTPTYRGTALQQWGSTATGTTAGISNASLGVLRFQNCNAGLIYTNGASPIIISTSNAERLRITSDGKLGLGTSAPLYTFDCRGPAGIEIYNGAGGGDVLNFRPSLGDANKYNLSISSYDHSGNGVGPADGLSINGFDGVSICTGTDTSRTERLRVTQAGNVGIGTSSPSAPLDVNGSIRASNYHILDSSTLVAGTVGFSTSNGPALEFWGSAAAGGGSLIAKTAGSERARLDSSGRLLVGTSVDAGGAAFQVNGDRIRVGTAKTPASATATGTAGEICWDTSYIYVCTATNTWKRAALSTW